MGDRMIHARTRRLAVVIALVLCALSTRSAHATKTDILVLRNGDKITGEIKELDRARLKYSTDDIGTIYIEWNKVASLTSPKTYDVELESGRRHYGSLVAAPSVGLLRIAGYGDTVLVGVLSVVHISALEQSLFKRMDGSVDVGFYIASANHLSQLSVDFAVLYRTRERIANLTGSAQRTHQEDVDDVERSSLSLSYSRVLTNRWFALAQTGTERNSELGIDLRWSLAVLGGRYIVQTNSSLFGVGAGISGNVENPKAGEMRWNTEAVVGANWALFGYDFPKTDISISVQAYRDLTRDRFRFEGDANIKREIIKDFTVGLTAAESFDSDPPSGGVENDWTLKFTVGWTY
jgi:Protein of unknown function, DUF481